MENNILKLISVFALTACMSFSGDILAKGGGHGGEEGMAVDMEEEGMAYGMEDMEAGIVVGMDM